MLGMAFITNWQQLAACRTLLGYVRYGSRPPPVSISWTLTSRPAPSLPPLIRAASSRPASSLAALCAYRPTRSLRWRMLTAANALQPHLDLVHALRDGQAHGLLLPLVDGPLWLLQHHRMGHVEARRHPRSRGLAVRGLPLPLRLTCPAREPSLTPSPPLAAGFSCSSVPSLSASASSRTSSSVRPRGPRCARTAR